MLNSPCTSDRVLWNLFEWIKTPFNLDVYEEKSLLGQFCMKGSG